MANIFTVRFEIIHFLLKKTYYYILRLYAIMYLYFRTLEQDRRINETWS